NPVKKCCIVYALQMKETCQETDYCVTFNEGEIRAEAGLCAVIPCTFTSIFVPKDIIWYKCESYQDRCDNSGKIFYSVKNKENIHPGFKGRVSLVEPNVAQKNCSIIINDLKESDSGRYQLRIEGKATGEAFSYKEKTTLSVTGLNQKPSMMIPPLTEGQLVTLTCTAPGLCSGSPPNITWMWRGKGENDSFIKGNITALKTENLTAFTQRHVSTLTFNSSADHHNTKITCKVSFTGGITTEETVTLNVTYLRKPRISGRTTVKEGDDLNLTCSVDSVPPSTNISSKLQNSSENLKQEQSGTLFINRVTAEHAGLYTCTASLPNINETDRIILTVTYKSQPQITGNTIVKEGDDLNLTCNVESFPQSVVVWTKHSASEIYLQNNTGSATLVISNVTAPDSGRYVCTATHLNETVSAYADVKITFIQSKTILEKISSLEVVVAFLIGALLSAIICCLAVKCSRNKRQSIFKLNPFSVQNNLKTNSGFSCANNTTIHQSLIVQNDKSHVQEEAKNLPMAGEKSASEMSKDPKDVQYASIDFSVMKQRRAKEAAKERASTLTEYAEIKTGPKEQSEDGSKEGSETLEGEEEDLMTKRCVSEEQTEVEAVYSTVKDVLDEI
uniref:B-cell receptor CD22 n=1 Tax=Poecilia formosa TaxID=48698 RepID=A0A087XDW3_POEFO